MRHFKHIGIGGVTLLVAILLAAQAGGEDVGDEHITWIRDRELPHIAEILGLSDDQVTVVAALRSEYEQHARAEYWPAYLKYWEGVQGTRREEHAFLDRVHDGEVYPEDVPDRSDAFHDAYAKLPPALELLHELDEKLFQEIEALLTPEQLPAMERLRLYRARTIHRITLRSMAETDVDLISLVEAITPTLDADAMAELKEWELRYAERLAACLRQVTEARPRWRRSWAQGHYNLIMSMAEWGRAEVEDREVDMVKIEAWTEAHRDASERGGRIAISCYRAIVALNRAELAFLMQLLSPEDAAALTDLYERTAYPGVYPDPGHAEGLYASALALDDLSVEQEHAIGVHYDEYVREHDRLSEKMAESIYNRHEANVYRALNRERTIGQYWEDLRIYSERRHALNREQRARLAVLLNPEQIVLLKSGPWDEEDPIRRWDPRDDRAR